MANKKNIKNFRDYYAETIEQLVEKLKTVMLKYNIKFGYGLVAALDMIKNKVKRV